MQDLDPHEPNDLLLQTKSTPHAETKVTMMSDDTKAAAIRCVQCQGAIPSIAIKLDNPKCRFCFKNQWTLKQRKKFFNETNPNFNLPGCTLCNCYPTNGTGYCYSCFEGTYGPNGGGFAHW